MVLKKIKSTYLLLFLCVITFLFSCGKQAKKNETKPTDSKQGSIVLKTGAERTNLYFSTLLRKNVAVVANQTSVIESKDKKQFVHLVDSLLSAEINVQKVFAPEHGFRGKADAGEVVKDGIDTKTNLPIISLYGKNKKPSAEQLNGIDVVIFDIQDVGARFYTYISTLHYVMEACAEAKIPVIVLDRPNPNGHYIDGPVLEAEYKSFVGMHKVPVVYGMTIGEYGKMINGEKWLENEIQCDLKVVPLEGYTHNSKYSLPIKPSPNLPNDKSINLYPSLCFFEGTNVSAGRGTDKQFQIYGSPYMTDEEIDYSFIPKANEGAKYPKHLGKECQGLDLSDEEFLNSIRLTYLIKAYSCTSDKSKFWNNFFTKLAGTKKLKQQIEQGLSEEKIRQSWQKDLDEFKKVRNKYLIYE